MKMFSFDDYMEMEDSNRGACITCGTWADHVGPDAKGLKCDGCKHSTVYGSNSLLNMGRIKDAETPIV